MLLDIKKTGLFSKSGLLIVHLLSNFVNRDLLAVLAHALKLHSAVHEGEQSVVTTLTDVSAGVDLSSALSDKDVAGQNELSVGSLYTKALRLTVAAVLGRTHTFFMCHLGYTSMCQNVIAELIQALIASI